MDLKEEQAKRGFAAIQNLLAKAAQGGEPDDADAEKDDLDLDLDFSDLDEAQGEADDGEGQGPEEEEEDGEGKGQPVAKAAQGQGEEIVDAGPILMEVAQSLRDLSQQNATLREQNATLAKAMSFQLGVNQQLLKRLERLEAMLGNTPTIAKASNVRLKGQGQAQAQGLGLDVEGVIAKAAVDTANFTASQVARLESLLRSGRTAELPRHFSAGQLEAVGIKL
ncbi:hypothetical protein [Calidithermus chliarophilus]|uniref:hypothetical protein n=1 Tax=Calidithermus chliarophilus TaxID=52023 RepID=UPI00041D9C43|nr:hypothetical protein [Calidithermus chliarophilus]